MVLRRSTNNSMAAGFLSTACTSSPSLSSASVAVTAGTSSSLSDQIASAVATALGNSLPAIMAAIRDNSAPVSSAPPAVTSVSSSSAMVVAGIPGGAFWYVEVTVICFYFSSGTCHLWL